MVSWEDRAVAHGIGAPVNICLASGGNQAAVSSVSPSASNSHHDRRYEPFGHLFLFLLGSLPSLVMLWPLGKARDITESNSQLRGATVFTANSAQRA